MSMITIIKVRDLLDIRQHLGELSFYKEGSEQFVHIKYNSFEAVGYPVGDEHIEFGRSAREAVWEICARVGIPFRFV